MFYITFSRDLLLRSDCSEQEKKTLLPLINQFMIHGRMVRDSGIGALSSVVDTSDKHYSAFFNYAISVVLTHPRREVFEEKLVSPLYQTSLSGLELLARLIIVKGVESMWTKCGLYFQLKRLCALLVSYDEKSNNACSFDKWCLAVEALSA